MKKVFLIVCLLACVAPVNAQQKPKSDRVVAVKTVSGRTLGFEMGDYQHVEVRLTNGRRKSFFIFKPGLDYFLALNKAKLLTLTYEVADVHIPEAGGIQRVERLRSAKYGTVTYESWWKEMTAKYTIEQLDNKYGPVVSKYQLNR
jgi:hypothetical protein